MPVQFFLETLALRLQCDGMVVRYGGINGVGREPFEPFYEQPATGDWLGRRDAPPHPARREQVTHRPRWV